MFSSLSSLIGLGIYFYVAIISFLLGIIPIFVIFKYSKIERDKIKSKAIYQYRERMKNIMPRAFMNLWISIIIVMVFMSAFMYVLTKSLIFTIIIDCVLFIMALFIGFYKFPVYITENGIYYNTYYTWKAFEGYERIGDKIKLIGKNIQLLMFI